MRVSDVRFTYTRYEQLLESLEDEGYRFRGYQDSTDVRTVLMRHDIDYSPRKALKLAELENEHDVKSTYFFLLTTQFYNLLNDECRRILHEITDLGHDVGLHFSTHQYWTDPKGKSEVEEAVQREIQVLESFSRRNVDTVSFHNPPEWVFREGYRGFVSTYEPRFFDEIGYMADSNQRWRGDEPFRSELPDKLQILTHPVLWGDEDASVTERLEEERDYVFRSIGGFIEQESDLWN